MSGASSTYPTNTRPANSVTIGFNHLAQDAVDALKFEALTIQEFTHHVLPLKQKLYRLAYSLLSSSDDAKDVVQDVFVKLWDQALPLARIANIEAYCMRMTRNRALDILRRKGRHHQSIEGSWDIESHGPTPLEQIRQLDNVTLIRKAIASLDQRYQEVIYLRDIEEYSYKEIAQNLGLSDGNVRVMLHRARIQVKKYIESTLGKEATHSV